MVEAEKVLNIKNIRLNNFRIYLQEKLVVEENIYRETGRTVPLMRMLTIQEILDKFNDSGLEES